MSKSEGKVYLNRETHDRLHRIGEYFGWRDDDGNVLAHNKIVEQLVGDIYIALGLNGKRSLLNDRKFQRTLNAYAELYDLTHDNGQQRYQQQPQEDERREDKKPLPPASSPATVPQKPLVEIRSAGLLDDDD